MCLTILWGWRLKGSHNGLDRLFYYGICPGQVFPTVTRAYLGPCSNVCNDFFYCKHSEQKSPSDPVGIYLLKVNKRNTRTRSEICSMLTIKTSE